MFGYSNDWFYANSLELMLNTKGDLSSKTAFFDNGTAMNQYPGAGNAQGLFGGTQIVEDQAIKTVGNEFPVPAMDNVLKVTLQ
ncbi:MAG: spondin domain-containing protein [Sphingobacterium sp.]